MQKKNHTKKGLTPTHKTPKTPPPPPKKNKINININKTKKKL
jgi:hypothetical protein